MRLRTALAASCALALGAAAALLSQTPQTSPATAAPAPETSQTAPVAPPPSASGTTPVPHPTPAAPFKPPPPSTYPLVGRLILTEKGAPSKDPSIDLTEGAVWYEPDEGMTAPKAKTAQMVTVKKQFSPQLLVVPVGSTVAFPNQDPILHNVFSVSGRNKFDLGLVGGGKGKSVVFREAGLVRVFCNVHHAMFASILVVRTPHFARLDAQGAFRLEGVPAGGGQLFFWHGRGEPASRRIQVPLSADLKLEVPVTVARIPAHKNKLGESYTRGAYD